MKQDEEFLRLLPPGTMFDTTFWLTLSALSIPFYMLGMLIETFVFNNLSIYMQGVLLLCWRRCRLGYHMWCVKHCMKDYTQAQIVRLISGNVSPQGHAAAESAAREKVKVSLRHLTLYLREVDPGFLGPQWHATADFQDAHFGP